MVTKRKLERLSGHAARKLVRQGTGSEHMAIVLQTESGENMVLQRVGGNPFDDETTRALADRDVEVEGFRVGNTFRFTKAKPR